MAVSCKGEFRLNFDKTNQNLKPKKKEEKSISLSDTPQKNYFNEISRRK